MMALAKAQGQIHEIERDRTVRVQPRQGAAYEFKYATLSAIIKGIKKALSDNCIAYTQVLTFEKNEGRVYLTTSLHHKNQFISSVVPLIVSGDTGNQQFGSALTYMKRYTLAALVGVAADEDDDGNMADGNEVQAMQAAVNKSPKVPAADPIKPKPKEDPISSGPFPGDSPMEGFNPARVIIPEPNGNPDWMAWGKAFMEQARAAPSGDDLALLEAANLDPLKMMEAQAPRMYTNLSMSLIKVRNALEKRNAG